MREMLRTPGATHGAWSILDALLTATGPDTSFIFKESLGQARVVKVALSDLFGRFVARANLDRYFDLSIFARLVSPSLLLDGRRRIDIIRRSRGDLPDWVACAADRTSLTVAEAKGCYYTDGRARGWAQGPRIDVSARGRKVTIKRIAIATRWGGALKGPAQAYLPVRDPVDEGEQIDAEGKKPVFIGLLRHHIANLINPLGHAEPAGALRHLASKHFQRNVMSARAHLDAAQVRARH